jgi:hypothetical protein
MRAAAAYKLKVDARRRQLVRLNDLANPDKIPVGKECSSVMESDMPVEYTRVESTVLDCAIEYDLVCPPIGTTRFAVCVSHNLYASDRILARRTRLVRRSVPILNVFWRSYGDF